ncbi:MAG: class II aldolase/adducin family protein [Eubacteriales bacterium]
MGIETIVNISHKYGLNEEFVLAGGGNTSYKDEENLYIKGSGTSLATIKAEGFVKMSRKSLSKIWEKTYPQNSKEREAQVLKDMMGAKCEGEEAKRPSVETLLHNLFPHTYILHVHPARVNGITCSNDGEKVVKRLFPDAIWVKETEPGYILASECRSKLEKYKAETGKAANLLFLQNHGIFFAANSEKELDLLVSHVIEEIKAQEKIVPDLTTVKEDAEAVEKIKTVLASSLGGATVKFTLNKEIAALCKSREDFAPVLYPMTPDHIVYCKSSPLFADSLESIGKDVLDYSDKHGFMPKIVFVKNVGMFACGKDEKDAATAEKLWLDEIKISVYAKNFGGVRPMAENMIDFIANWEVESYRSKVAEGKA